MSSSYKPNAPRHTAESTTELSLNHKLQEKVSKLQELFSTWSSDDIQSVLTETAGDVELAAARISEGYAEQWGSVTRKKDKKPQRSHQSTVSYSSRPGDRQSNESRGSNRGRGRGRGGGRGASRAPPQSVHPHSKDYLANGTSVHLSITDISSSIESASDTAVPTAPTLSADKSITGGAGADMSVSPTPFVHDNAHAKVFHPIHIGPTVVEQEVTITDSTSISKPSATKTLSTSKRSWAQIAKPREKLKSSISSSLVGPQHLPSATAPAVPPAVSEQPLTSSQPIEITTWEEPTTVPVLPAWEEESPSTLPQPSQLSLSENSMTMTTTTATSDGWISTDTATSPLPPQDIWEAKPSMPPLSPSLSTHELTWAQVQPTGEVSNTSVTTDASITPTSIAPATSITSVPVSTASVPSKPSTPSVAHARPLSVHRSNAKFSKDQAVVISAFAGNIAPHTEKLGMQFGSLNLNGDDTFDGSITLDRDSETTTVLPPDAPKQDPVQSQQAQAAVQTQPQEPVQPPTHVQPSQPVFTQSTSHQQPPTSVVSMQAQQATQTSQPSAPVASFSSHPALTHQQPQHHHQSQHTYGHQQQSIHFDGPQPQGPHGSGSQNNSYFRPEPPFYHTPTPPQNAPPDHQSGYPAAFSPVGMGTGIHGHSQNLGGQNVTHLSGFGGIPGAEYNYSEGQRGFYDYVPSGFGSRVGHDEPGKGNLPLAQGGNQPSSVLTSNTSQAQNTNGPQTSSTQPPTSQQNQQGYPPMQYFYPPFFQNTYHPPYPNASYSQPYVPKFPVYTQGPVGPGSAPPSGKGLGGPYNPPGSQSHLYHGQGGFDDPGSGYPHHQSSTNLGAADFQKQTPHHHHQQPQQHYGGQPNQGLQSFLSMQQSAGAGQSVGPTAQSRSGASPESTYKPYGGTVGATDKPVGIVQSGQQGRGATVQQGQQQGGSFYPGGRFGGSASTGPQHQGQQQAYAQGAEQGQFYSYQPRQQHQGVYWQ